MLTIAGSDSGGGAGIQADLKAFARCGVHGMSAVTAITAQNTVEVRAVQALPAVMVIAQARAVIEDIGVDAVKVGMLANAELATAVGGLLAGLGGDIPVVVDPVMVAESGARLLAETAQDALIAEVLPRATVLTPNLPEALVLAGRDANDTVDAETLAREVLALGPRVVVLTGGHRERATDLFVDCGDPATVHAIEGVRHPDGAAHGSGCTHSSVLAAQLALGRSPLQAARTARALTGEAIAEGLRDLGAGAGPVDVIGLSRMRERLGRALRGLT